MGDREGNSNASTNPKGCYLIVMQVFLDQRHHDIVV